MTAEPIDSQKLHQMARIAWPEVYERAQRGAPLWFSVWEGDTRVKWLSVIPAEIRIEETDISIALLTDYVQWEKPKPSRLKRRQQRRRITNIRVGIAYERDLPPHKFIQVSGIWADFGDTIRGRLISTIGR